MEFGCFAAVLRSATKQLPLWVRIPDPLAKEIPNGQAQKDKDR
jgi:hypothetical protein